MLPLVRLAARNAECLIVVCVLTILACATPDQLRRGQIQIDIVGGHRSTSLSQDAEDRYWFDIQYRDEANVLCSETIQVSLRVWTQFRHRASACMVHGMARLADVRECR